MSKGFWYLGSPYSKHPAGIDEAHYEVCWEAGRLILAGVSVYSPIAHTHPIAGHCRIDPHDHCIWLPVDEPMMEAARGLIVLKMAGWAASAGLIYETNFFAERGRPIVYMTPGTVPEELL